MSEETQYPKENKNEKNIFLMNDDERTKYIYDVITHDSHFSDVLLDFKSFSRYINITLITYLIHDKKNPIVTKFGESVYFEPLQKFIDEDGFNRAYIKYATHFISGHIKNAENRDIRSFDNSKFDAIQLLIPALESTDINRLYQKENKLKGRKEAIIYAKEMEINKVQCLILVTETTKKGEVRSITFFPKRGCGYIQKQKASGDWSDAPIVTRSIEKDSPSDETITMSVGGNVRHDSNTKSNNKNDTNDNLPLELYDTNTGKVVIEYQIIDNQIVINDKIVSFDELLRMFLKKTGRMEQGGIVESIMSFFNERITFKGFFN